VKIEDLQTESRSLTKGDQVILELDPLMKNKYKSEKITSLKTKITEAVEELLEYYNKGKSLKGKLKRNNSGTNKYHYHIGYPFYTRSANGDYQTSDWFILFELVQNSDSTYKLVIYDYDNHMRDGVW
jgi:hypothetical protein